MTEPAEKIRRSARAVDAGRYAQVAPWAETVETPPGVRLLFVSGQAPAALSEKEGAAGYGDMEAQTRTALRSLVDALGRSGFTAGDVVKLTAYLVGEERLGGRPDLEGFGRAWREVFGSDDQPNLPARTRVLVAGLMHPDWLVEIDAVAASAGSRV